MEDVNGLRSGLSAIYHSPKDQYMAAMELAKAWRAGSKEAPKSLPYKNWIIDPKISEDRWVRMAEARPGAAEVVHHLVVYILEPDGRPMANISWWSVLDM